MSPIAPRRPSAPPWVRQAQQTCLLAVAMLCITCPVLNAAQTTPRPHVDARPWVAAPEWRVLGVEYARSEPLAVRRLVKGAPPGEQVAMSWLFYVVVGHHKVVLVDAGTDEFAKRPAGALAKKWQIGWSRTVSDSLQSVGLQPVDVTDILLTHRHWDHVGGTARFGTAQVHMHAAEWRAVSQKVRDTVSKTRQRLWRESPYTPSPGLTMHVKGLHTRHHAVVEVTCRERTIALVGDGAYLWANLVNRQPVTVTHHPRGNVREMTALSERLGVWNVLPGHEPAIFSRYPSQDARVALICQ